MPVQLRQPESEQYSQQLTHEDVSVSLLILFDMEVIFTLYGIVHVANRELE